MSSTCQTFKSGLTYAGVPLLPMTFNDRTGSFDDPGWRFEIKVDGYRALALIVGGCVRLVSRNGCDLIGWFPTLSSLGKRTQRIASTSTSTKYDSLPRPATNTSVQGGNDVPTRLR